MVYFYTVKSDYIISAKNLTAAAPPGVSVAFANSVPGGAEIIALAESNTGVPSFMRQLTADGAANVNLTELRRINACGSTLTRANIRIEGNNAGLRYVDHVPAFAEVPVRSGNGETSCKLPLR